MVKKEFEELIKPYSNMPEAYSTPRGDRRYQKESWIKQQKWAIPEAFVIKAAVTGGFIMKEDNPNQKYTSEENSNEVIKSLDAGACSFHIHVRNEQGRHSLDLKQYHDVIDPIKEKYGDNVLVCGCPEGGATVEDSLRPLIEFADVFEVAPVTCTAVNFCGDISVCRTPESVQAHVQVSQQVGVKPEIVLHNVGDLSLVKRWLIETKIAEEPLYFRIAHGNPGWGYIEDPYTMFESISFMVRELNKMAPGCAIMLDMAGRAGLFLVATALTLGLIGVRVGMEDALYMYPHKDEMIRDNESVVKKAVQMTESLGRKVGTADDYRKFVGIKPLLGH